MQVLASQLHFLANRNAVLAIPPLFWPVNCIKVGEHAALLSGPTVHSLYCGTRLGMSEICLPLSSRICPLFLLPAFIGIFKRRGQPEVLNFVWYCKCFIEGE